MAVAIAIAATIVLVIIFVIALLESAVGRQQTGFGPFRKYPEPLSNAATLMYGICNDHPFHNGNKRTALASMLAHLDKNRLHAEGNSSARRALRHDGLARKP